MILYCCQHPASILRAVIHKFKYHEFEEAIILGEYPIGSPYYPAIENISYYQMPSVHKMVTFCQDKSTMGKNIQLTIDDFVKKIGYSFSEFEKIYAIYDMYNPFTIYFEIMNIKYMCIELNDNMFNYYWSEDYVDTRPEEARCFNLLIKEMHSQDGQGKNCLKGFLFSKYSKKPQDGKVPTEVFDYYGTLLSLNESCNRKLIQAYNLDIFSFDALMMFNSPGWTEHELKEKNIFLTSDQKKNASMFYKEVLDYYFKDIDFSLKLHPASNRDFVSSFSAFKQVPSHIFVELFAMMGRKYRIFCPVQSTGIGIFQRLGFDITYFGVNLIPFFKYIHFVYLAFSLIKSFGLPEQIFVYGIDIIQLDYFKNWAYKDFKNVKNVKLTKDNVKRAKFIIAEADSEFESLIQDCMSDCIIIVNEDYKCEPTFSIQKMIYTVIDASEAEWVELEKIKWTVLSQNEKILKKARNFSAFNILNNAKLIIQCVPYSDFMKVGGRGKETLEYDECEKLRIREKELIKSHKFLQMYYEAERTGYTLKDYLEERGLLSDKVKIAFYAVDELGVFVYRICERYNIHFAVLISDKDRRIICQTHPNLTGILEFRSMDSVSKEEYTTVFMATTWNKEQIGFVRQHCPAFFLFDAVAQAMYTRAFFINKIAVIKEKNPGVNAGIYFTPTIRQVPGEHSELEQYFSEKGDIRIADIKDNLWKERVKNDCYRKYGFDNEYIEDVNKIQYHYVTNVDSVTLLDDYASKNINIVNHRRMTTDTPESFNNTVYFFGDSVACGFCVGDAETIESNFQRILNMKHLPYIVQNCSNSVESNYDRIFSLVETMSFQAGDILLFCSAVDWLTEQYIKQKNRKLLCDVLGIYTTPIFQRPHNHGEVFANDRYFNAKGYSLIAQKIYEDIERAGFFDTPPNENGKSLKALADESNQGKIPGGE